MDKKALLLERQSRLSDHIMNDMRKRVDTLEQDKALLEEQKAPLITKIINRIKALWDK